MSRIRQPLPEYGTLIRWTVQEVINWLSENKIDCSKCFREGGVDGNKLVNVTEIDLMNIRCPRKYIKEILSHVERVSRPGAPVRTGGGGYGTRSNQRQVPFNETNHNQDDRSGSDDAAWDEDEFDSDFDDDNDKPVPTKRYIKYKTDNTSAGSYNHPVENLPVAPPRPNRREAPPLPSSKRPQPEPEEEEFYLEPDEASEQPLQSGHDRPPPPVPDSRGRRSPPNVQGRHPTHNVRGRPPAQVPDLDGPNEDYEDPDANLKVSNFHGGPLPTPPTQVNKKMPIAQRKPPPLPETPADSSDSSDSVEEYEDPDSTVINKAPPIPTGPRRPPPTLAEPEEEYEQPDAMVAKKQPQTSGQRKPPPPPVSSVPTSRSVKNRPPVEEEEYENPDDTVSKPQPPPLSKLPRKPSTPSSELPSYEMPDEQSPPPPPVPRNVPRKKSHQPIIEPEETYEIPDETSSTPSKSTSHMFNKQVEEEEVYEVPDADDTEDQDDYLNMEQDVTPPSKQLPVQSASKSKSVTGGQRDAMPLPGKSKSNGRKPDRKAPVEPPVEEEEVKAPQRKKMGVPVLPVVSNGVNEPPKHSPRQGRALPPPPAVTPEKSKPEKIETVKPPVTKTTPQKTELTETDLLRQKWYHGNIKRIDAEIKLKQLNIDGMYLIRKSSQGSDQPYTLQIFYRGKCYNLPIRRRSDNLFAVGKEEKEGEKAFSSLLDLVNMFKQNILVLSGGAETKLVKSLPKS